MQKLKPRFTESPWYKGSKRGQNTVLSRLFNIKWKTNTSELPNSKLVSWTSNPPDEPLCFLGPWCGRSGCCVAEGMLGGSTDRAGAAMEPEPGLGYQRSLVDVSEWDEGSVGHSEPHRAGAAPAPEIEVPSMIIEILMWNFFGMGM